MHAKCWLDAHHLCVGFCVDEAGVSVTCITADAAARPSMLLIETHSQRRMEGVQPHRREIRTQSLESFFMGDGGIGIGVCGRRLRRVHTTLSPYLEQILGLRIVGFQILVRNGPCGRHSTCMLNLSKIDFTQPKESRAKKLGVSADVVVRMRLENF